MHQRIFSNFIDESFETEHLDFSKTTAFKSFCNYIESDFLNIEVAFGNHKSIIIGWSQTIGLGKEISKCILQQTSDERKDIFISYITDIYDYLLKFKKQKKKSINTYLELYIVRVLETIDTYCNVDNIFCTSFVSFLKKFLFRMDEYAFSEPLNE